MAASLPPEGKWIHLLYPGLPWFPGESRLAAGVRRQGSPPGPKGSRAVLPLVITVSAQCDNCSPAPGTMTLYLPFLPPPYIALHN